MSKSDSSAQAWRMAAALASARTEGDAAGAVARSAANTLGADSAHVWLIDRVQGYRFAGSFPQEPAPPSSPPGGLPRAVAFGEVMVSPASPPHRSEMIVPLIRGSRPLGAVVFREHQRPAGAFTGEDAGALAPLLEAADEALPAIRQRFLRRERQVETVVRLTRLFDLSRSLTATPDIDDLHRTLVDRVKTSLEVECAYLWRPKEEGDGFHVVAAAGPVAGAALGWEMEPGQGIPGQVAESGEPLLLPDPSEVPDMEERPDVKAGLEIFSVAAAPLLSDDGEVQGVLEVVNAEGNDPYMEDGHLLFLNEITRTGVVALGNALRLEAEQRAGDLSSLLEAARSLSASLDKKKIAYTLVHQSASVIGFKRSAVGLFRGGKLEIAAVSGESVVDETRPEIKSLRDLLTWAAGLDEGFLAVQEEDGSVDVARPEAREKLKAYFAETGHRSFLSVPLVDDEGKIGVFALEGEEAYAFTGRELEAAELLAAHATTSIRNATLYEQIPLAKVFNPFSRSAKGRGSGRGRRLAWGGGLIAALVLLFAVPVPLRVSGEMRVLPQLRRPVVTEVEGRVQRVLVTEGQEVRAGDLIAILDDSDYRAAAEEARARYEVAMREQSRLRARGDIALAAVEAARGEAHRADLDLWRTRVEKSRIRTNTAGTVATPRIEEMVGVRLEEGEVFCEVVDPKSRRLEIAVPEVDAGLVSSGMPAKVKLRAYPTESFPARVEKVGVTSSVADGEPVFLVQARLQGRPDELKPGMTGLAKITVGPSSIARVVLRRPARWIWGLVWGWLP